MSNKENTNMNADELLAMQEDKDIHQYDGLDTGHDYDGIRELDNPLPGWWLLTLWGAIVFSIGYWFYFQTTGAGPDQAQELTVELEEANVKAAAYNKKMEASGQAAWSNNESLIKLATDTTAVARGKAAYDASCAACHVADGSGLIGPNLTDNMWLHGGEATAIFKTVSSGVLAKGMPAWRAQLGAKGVSEIVAYILTMRNKNLPGKAAQGTVYEGK